MSREMEGRAVLITGATRGIGRAAAVRLAQAAAMVLAVGRDEAAGAATVAAVEAAGGRCLFERCDVTREADWERAVARAMAAFGRLDAVVNNAGVFFVKPLAETTDAEWDWIYGVNVEGCWLGVKHGLKAFAAQKRAGAIVNVSSLMGQVGYPGAVAYCATKGAITALTKSAAVEGAAMSPPVRVNSLHPGVIWTEMLTSQFGDSPELAAGFAADTPLRRVGQPEDVAEAILFLASDASSYMAGAELTVDGGRGAD